tara:strand:- start:363 stop:836 length:474 start_codon:yes stop_codon:yes gene_type:complete
MSQQGTRAFYLLSDKIKERLLLDPNVNTVTFGDITDIDLSKQTMFPLSHVMINSVTFNSPVMTFNISVLSMDIVDVSKEKTVDIYRGNTNDQDILNTQLEVQNRLFAEMSKGSLYDTYQLIGTPTTEPFRDRFENEVAGWAVTFDVQFINDIDNCGV